MGITQKALKAGNRLMISQGAPHLYDGETPILTPDGIPVSVLTINATDIAQLGIDPFTLQAEIVYKAWFLGNDNEPSAHGQWQLSRDNGNTFIPLAFRRKEPRAGYWVLLLAQPR